MTRATCKEIHTYKLKFRVDCDMVAPVLFTRLLTNHSDIISQIITKKIFEHRLTQETAKTRYIENIKTRILHGQTLALP